MDCDYSEQAPGAAAIKNFITQESFITAFPHSFPDNLNYPFNSVLVGSGISNREALSRDVPFDVLNLILASERIRREFNLDTVNHLIADAHAEINGFNQAAISAVSTKTRAILQQIVNRLGFKNYKFFTASELSQDPRYVSIMESLSDKKAEGPYELREAGDIEYFRRWHGAGIKLGWTMRGANFDEIHFDKSYLSLYQHPLIFLYTPSGVKLTDRFPNTVPYTLLEGDSPFRFILDPREDPARKLANADCSRETRNYALNHYKRLLRLYRYFDEIPNSVGKTTEQIDWVIHRLLD